MLTLQACPANLLSIPSVTAPPALPWCCACSITQHLLQLLGTDGLLAIPTTPGPAFINDQIDPAAFQQLRLASLSLTSIAGLAGLPQVMLMNLLIGYCLTVLCMAEEL
jgi:hypothetical protein